MVTIIPRIKPKYNYLTVILYGSFRNPVQLACQVLSDLHECYHSLKECCRQLYACGGFSSQRENIRQMFSSLTRENKMVSASGGGQLRGSNRNNSGKKKTLSSSIKQKKEGKKSHRMISFENVFCCRFKTDRDEYMLLCFHLAKVP